MKLFGRDPERGTLKQIVNTVRTGESRALVLLANPAWARQRCSSI